MKPQVEYALWLTWHGGLTMQLGYANLRTNSEGCDYQYMVRTSIWEYLKLDDHCDTLIFGGPKLDETDQTL